MNPDSGAYTFDVVVIGAGIIGLTIARKLLTDSGLSVALVDAAVPCSGATGAGQGYLWLVHKTPGTCVWDLALRSHKLWDMLVESVEREGMNPRALLGWRRNGSMLIGRSLEESDMLRRKVQQLSHAGVRAKYLSRSDLLLEEPALMVGEEGGAAFLPDDCQIDAWKVAAFIEEGNRKFAPEGRYGEFYNNAATRLIRSSGNAKVHVVQTSYNTMYCKKAVVVAAGCWTGSLINDLLSGLNITINLPVTPRKGHLLVLENFDWLEVNHGLMEMGYVDHEDTILHPSDFASQNLEPSLSVSMTATKDSSGNVLLGSSRQFSGFNTDSDESVINSILKRARQFFPVLGEVSPTILSNRMKVRVGLRPYSKSSNCVCYWAFGNGPVMPVHMHGPGLSDMLLLMSVPDCKPVIGPIPGLPNVFLAAGHEGSGLSMAMGTAEIVADMILGNPGKIDWGPFLVDRLFTA